MSRQQGLLLIELMVLRVIIAGAGLSAAMSVRSPCLRNPYGELCGCSAVDRLLPWRRIGGGSRLTRKCLTVARRRYRWAHSIPC